MSPNDAGRDAVLDRLHAFSACPRVNVVGGRQGPRRRRRANVLAQHIHQPREHLSGGTRSARTSPEHDHRLRAGAVASVRAIAPAARGPSATVAAREAARRRCKGARMRQRPSCGSDQLHELRACDAPRARPRGVRDRVVDDRVRIRPPRRPAGVLYDRTAPTVSRRRRLRCRRCGVRLPWCDLRRRLIRRARVPRACKRTASGSSVTRAPRRHTKRHPLLQCWYVIASRRNGQLLPLLGEPTWSAPEVASSSSIQPTCTFQSRRAVPWPALRRGCLCYDGGPWSRKLTVGSGVWRQNSSVLPLKVQFFSMRPRCRPGSPSRLEPSESCAACRRRQRRIHVDEDSVFVEAMISSYGVSPGSIRHSTSEQAVSRPAVGAAVERSPSAPADSREVG